MVGKRDDGKYNRQIVETGKKVRKAREKAGYSQKELAIQIDITARTLSSIENGDVDDVKLTYLFKISDVLEIDVAELLPEKKNVEAHYNLFQRLTYKWRRLSSKSKENVFPYLECALDQEKLREERE